VLNDAFRAAGKDLMKNNVNARWASLRDLEIIKAMIEKGSVTLAAELLGISQPAVSKAIASIEEKSGKSLFYREKGRLLPTKDALFIYDEISNIFSSLERIEDNNWTSLKRKTIRIITTPTFAYSVISPLAAKYLKERNGVQVSVSVVKSIDVLNELREGKADIAFCNSAINNGLAELVALPMFTSKVVCMMNVNHELAFKEDIEINDLNYRNLIMYTEKNILSSKVKKILRERNIDVNVVAEVSDTLLALDFLNENLGIYIAPKFPIITKAGKNILIKPLNIDLTDDVSVFYLHTNLNPWCSDFIEFVNKNISDNMTR